MRTRNAGIGLLTAFAVWSLLVQLGALRGVDQAAMAVVKRAQGRELDVLAGVLNYLVAAEMSMLIGLVVTAWLWGRGVPLPTAATPLAWLLGLPVELALKFSLDQPPPGADLYRETLPYGFWTLKTMQSYPSGHAARAAFFAVFLGLLAWRFLDRGRLVVLALGLLAGTSAWCRVYQGMHWPSDAVGGLMMGAGTACLAYWCLAPHLDAERPRTVLVRGLLGRRERAG